MARDTLSSEEKRLPTHTQEELLAMLVYTRKDGSAVAAMVTPEDFDGPHQDLARAVLEYRRKFKGKPPHKTSLPTLLNRLPVKSERLDVIEGIVKLLPMRLKQCNREFVKSGTLDFVKRQAYRAGLLEMLEMANKEYYEMDRMEAVIHKLAKQQPNLAQEGILFNDFARSTEWAKELDAGWSFGIDAFDEQNIKMRPKTLTLYPAPKNSGKSWFCINMGRECMKQGASVLHVTLEMSQNQVAKRYYQAWFAMATTDGDYWRPAFEKDESGLVTGWDIETLKPPLAATDENILAKLKAKQKLWGNELGRLYIQEFPTRSLTATALENFLDHLAAGDKRFQPDVVFIDYPDLMKITGKDYRLALGEAVMHLRGIAQQRNLAMICPTQVNRTGLQAKRVRGVHVAEDISKINTADLVLTYSQTDTERGLGLARLLVEYGRDHPVGREVVLAQAYHVGQYATDSAMAGAGYNTKMSNIDKERQGPPSSERTREEVRDEQRDMVTD